MAINTVKQDEDLRKLSNLEVSKRLFRYLKFYKLKLFTVLLLLIFVMVVNLINPYILKVAIDKMVTVKSIYKPETHKNSIYMKRFEEYERILQLLDQ